MSKGKTKDGEVIPKGTTEDSISAVSFYYMMDKDSWQLKIWLYPTNRSKTYNIPIRDSELGIWKAVVTQINSFDDFEPSSEASVW